MIFLEDFQFMNDSAYVLVFVLAAAGAFLLIYFTGLGIPFAKRTAPGKKEKQLYVLSYAASSVFAFLGGILLLNRLHGGEPSGAASFEILFIFAFFLAGCSKWFDNRTAPVFMILFGCLFMLIYENMMIMLNMAFYYMFIYELAFVIAAVALDRLYSKNLFSFMKRS